MKNRGGDFYAIFAGDKKASVKKLPSCAALLGKAEEEDEVSDSSEAANVAPFEMSALKARAFRASKKEREEEMKEMDNIALIEDVKGKRRGSRRMSIMPGSKNK